jgi:GT2 family glycosyltransferase
MDLCERARAAGFLTAIVAEARVVHYGNLSGGLRFCE